MNASFEAGVVEALVKSAAVYDPHMGIDHIKKKYPHLLADPVHNWRARTGIELVHEEPSVREQERIWKNWQLMTPEMKRKSDLKSMKFFGMNNATHHRLILRAK